jgi:DNA-binding Lrp family transcriptional regulator
LPDMDELDIRIFRSLASSQHVAPSNFQVRISIREIARKLGVDDMTVSNRYAKFARMGLLTRWRAAFNPSLFGYGMKEVLVKVEPESAKEEMIRKLRLVHGITVLMDLYGPHLLVTVLYENEASFSRTLQLISRITNAESTLQTRKLFPHCGTKSLSKTDWAIMKSLAMDARKPQIAVAAELGLSARTVKNRLEKLETERAIVTFMDLDVGALEGMIPVLVLFSYAKANQKSSVDHTVLSEFSGNYLWTRLTDTEHGYILIVLKSMSELKPAEELIKRIPGVADTHTFIVKRSITLFENSPTVPGSVQLASAVINET